MTIPRRRAAACALFPALLLAALTACGSNHSAKAAPTPTVNATPTNSSGTVSADPSSSQPGLTDPTPTPTNPTGGLHTVPARVTVTEPPVPFTGTGNFTGGVTVTVSKISAVKSSGQGPGQVSGQPALAFTLTLHNATKQALNLNHVEVNATYGSAATPADPDTGSSSAPLHGSLAAGAEASGTYVVDVPTADRNDVNLTVSYAASKPTVLFTGKA